MSTDPVDWNFSPQHWADWQRDDNWGPPSLPADAPRTVRTPGDAAHRFSRAVRWARTSITRGNESTTEEPMSNSEASRQARRQRHAAWSITGAALVAVIVLYCAIAAALAG